MKLVHEEYDLALDLLENKVNVLVIERHSLFTEIIQELYKQCNGEEGHFIISYNQKILSMSKTVEIITDILGIDCNNKRMLASLYQEIEQLVNENLIMESAQFNSSMIYYLERMLETVPYHLEYQADCIPTKIMKMVEMKFEMKDISLLERIVEYLGIKGKLYGTAVTIFVNLKMYLEKEELQSLYEYIFYNKLQVILIEGGVDAVLPEEQVTIIEVDKCIIKV